MRLEIRKNPRTGDTSYLLTVGEQEIVSARFSKWDWRTFIECGASERIADQMLGLELLTRRIEETGEAS